MCGRIVTKPRTGFHNLGTRAAEAIRSWFYVDYAKMTWWKKLEPVSE